MNKIKLGLLDFGYRKKGTSGQKVLTNVLQYSRLADETGFSCYWLGEHQQSGMAWSYPAIILPLIAGQTEKINVGIAGVLLSYHSPYLVAVNFKLLESCFPGRIDLGLANGNVADSIAERMVSTKDEDGKIFPNFYKKREELLRFFKNEEQPWHFDKMNIPPLGGTIPRLWKLTSSFDNLDDCVAQKLNICKSLFHTTQSEIVDRCRVNDFQKKFRDAHQIYPEISIAFTGLCDKDHMKARRNFIPIKKRYSEFTRNAIVGSPLYIKETLMDIYEKTGVDFFIFYDQNLSEKKKMETLEMLSKEFDLLTTRHPRSKT